MSRSIPEATVIYPKIPTAVWIDSLVRSTNAVRSYRDTYIELDLTHLTRISPIFLCLLAAVIEEGLLDRGNRFVLRHPHNRHASDLLRKARFMDDRPEKIESRFLQVRRLSRGRVLSAHDIVDLVGENLHVSPGIRRIMNVILSELFQNAIDHSGRDACYVCAGMWGRSRQVHISVVDFGVGIPNKLRSMYQNEIADNDDEALRLVLEKAFSTRTRKTGGRGYEFIQSVLQANKGRLCIYSGLSKASYRFDRGEYPITKKRDFFAGTAVDIQINKDEKSYYRLMDEQEEVF